MKTLKLYDESAMKVLEEELERKQKLIEEAALLIAGATLRIKEQQERINELETKCEACQKVLTAIHNKQGSAPIEKVQKAYGISS